MRAEKKYAEQIKGILVKITEDGEMPMYISNLNPKIFEKVFKPLVSTLKTLRTEAETSMREETKSTGEAEARIFLINQVV